jgi:two-component system sensor histidine kinase MtrB
MRGSLSSSLTRLAAAAMAVAAAGLAALVGINSALHFVARDLATAVESVRYAEEMELQLLIHREASNPVVKGTAKAELLRAVEGASATIQSTEERRLFGQLRDAVDAYFGEGAGEREIGAALTAAHRLSLINLDHAREARQRAELWALRADVAGVAAALVQLAGLIAFLVWLRRGPLRRVAALSDAMTRFRDGDLDSRAPEQGSRELVAMARSFNATAGALLRARQRQSGYVATAIHDLRTPLTAIQLAVGYLTPSRPLPPEARIRDLLRMIGRQLTRLNALTGDVLNSLQIEEGGLTLLREQFDLQAVASESVQMFRELAPEHVIDLEAPPEPLAYDGDRARLAQVLNNLLSNAVKYSPRGSSVRVELARVGGEIFLAVSDEGQGILPEDREGIFEAFERRSATHEAAPGTSLGLWVSKRVVEAHGGRLELESRVGRGSTFRVVLPAQPLAHLRAPEPAPDGLSPRAH